MRRIQETGGVIVILFLIFMVTQRIECYPSKWQPFYSSNDTSSVFQVSSLSSIVSSRDRGELIDGSALEKSAADSKRKGRNRREISGDSENTDDETERILEEAFRTSPDHARNRHETRPADEMNLRILHNFQPRPKKPEGHGDRIVFPDQTGVTNQKNILMEPLCRKGIFCEEAPQYPIDLINQAVRTDTKLKYFEIKDELEPTVALRTSARDATLCESKKQLLRPKIGMNRNKQWRYIVNTDNFTQAIGVEICENDASPCNLVDNFASGYNTTCKQNYIYRELVAVLSDNSVAMDSFRIPASCCCHVQFIGDSTRRMGIDV